MSKKKTTIKQNILSLKKNITEALTLPWLLIFTLMFVGVVTPIPVSYILAPEIYTNKPVGPLFIESIPLINNLLLLFHIVFALIAILIGPFLLYRPIFKDKPKWHRTLGKIYIFSCFSSAITVLPLALYNSNGSVAAFGFSIMSLAWFLTSFWAYTAARNKDFIAHRRWIIRSYAITLAFVHVNLTYKLFLPYDQMSINAAKVFQSLISWQINLLIVEIYIAATSFNGKFLGYKKWFHNLIHKSNKDAFHWTYQRRVKNKASKTAH